jgi:hypothetical protein
VADLKPGDTVVVRGQAGADGTVAATSMTTANGAGGFVGAGGGRAGRNGGQGAANRAADTQTTADRPAPCSAERTAALVWRALGGDPPTDGPVSR